MIKIDEETNQIKEKVRRYLEEKEGLDRESCFFLCKNLEEEYWEDIKDEDENEEPEEEDEFDDFEDTEEQKKKVVREPPRPPKHLDTRKNKEIIKRPKIPIEKTEEEIDF